MKKKFLRWWYRVTGQKAEAEYFLKLALLAKVMDDEDNGKGYRLWRDAWGHIWDVFKEEGE